MKKIGLTYETLFELLGENKTTDSEGIEYKDTKVKIFVKTPDNELVQINKLIKKPVTDICGIETEKGKVFDCATRHLFQDKSGNSVRADKATEILTTDGLEKIIETTPLGQANVFDISIPAPHWYTSPNGIIHHNSYLSYGVMREFLEQNEKGRVVLFDTEVAVDKEDLAGRGIDIKRVVLMYPESIQEFRTQSTQILDGYSKLKKDQKIPLLFVLDSLSNLASAKETDDAVEGKEVTDMTRAKTIRSVFRIITPKLGKNKISMIVTNHTYDNIMSMYGGKEISGGGGFKYAASTIVTLGKRKDQDADKTVKGLIITAKSYKSRFTKPEKKVELNLDFTKGLGRYYGLLDIAEEYGIFPKTGNKYETEHGKFFGTAINKNPERFFTKEILLRVDEACKTEFMFGANEAAEEEIDDEVDDTEE